MELDDVLEFILMVILLHEAYEQLQIINGNRRFWVRPLYHDRDTRGYFAANFEEMYNNDGEQLKTTVRMDKKNFDLLFNLVKEGLTKHSNRPSISAKCRLFLTLA